MSAALAINVYDGDHTGQLKLKYYQTSPTCSCCHCEEILALCTAFMLSINGSEIGVDG